jgi:probable biosynthetic protein (TIGR04099 family)
MFAQIVRGAVASPAGLHFDNLEPVTVGMPELCRVGLSETWLLKACGHRHWMALADAFGLDRPRFTSATGERLYPAFTSVALSDCRLESVDEDCRLTFAVDLRRIGRTRFASDIMITVAGAIVAKARMESAFVQRMVVGSNRSATRALVARPCRLLPPNIMADRPFRADRWDRVGVFRRTERAELARMVIDPSPHEDFNGADFLYFAAYQSMLDRAEWRWLRPVSTMFATRNRTIHYFGNAELGDRIVATMCGRRNGPEAVEHWIELRRESDDALIALAFTRRKAVQPVQRRL